MNPLVLSIVIFSVILLAFVLVVVNEIRKKKQGKSSCGSCSGCPMRNTCHTSRKKEK